MFENEIAINEFQIGQFQKIADDISDRSLFQLVAGHGHPPLWILGHLAIAGESGQRMLGGKITHREWLRLFGPGSSDRISEDASLTKSVMVAAVISAYEALRTMAASVDAESLSHPHGVALFDGTPIKTVGHLVSVLLTNHFAFHLAQLSSCRRSEGHAALF